LKQKKLRAAEIKIRDLENSRDNWKERAKKAEKELLQPEKVFKEGQKKGVKVRKAKLKKKRSQ
jgi:hypothetical protein